MQGRSGNRFKVVLLTLDSLRADCMCQGLAPNLMRFGESAVVFTQAFVQGPYTTMSVPSLLTGVYPSRLPLLKVRNMFGVGVEPARTLPSLLKAAGYQTLGFHSNPFLSRIFGFERGFDHFDDDLLLQSLSWSNPLRLLVNRIQRLRRLHPFLPAEALNCKILAHQRALREPFFLWVHYMDTHGPYHSGGRWNPMAKLRAERLWFKATRNPQQITTAEREELLSSYHNRVSYLDHCVGAILETLAQSPSWGRTIVAIAADHGDEFGEHGGYTHRHKLYDELIHVPFMLRVPGVQPRAVTKLVEMIQLVPTLLDLVGVTRSSPTEFDGASLYPVLCGWDDQTPGIAYSEAELEPNYIASVRDAEWKLIYNPTAGGYSLYQLAVDSAERKNMAASFPEVTGRLAEILEARHSGRRTFECGALSALDEETVESRLRDLGYLD